MVNNSLHPFSVVYVAAFSEIPLQYNFRITLLLEHSNLESFSPPKNKALNIEIIFCAFCFFFCYDSVMISPSLSPSHTHCNSILYMEGDAGSDLML